MDKRLHAIRFYLLLAIKMQLLFHFQLYRQAMGIPPRLAQNIIALHGFIAREQIFDTARQNMADMRFPVCRRRAIIKGKFRPALSRLLRLFKDLFLFPEGEHLFLSSDKV